MRSRPATIGGIMIAVIGCALLFALVRMPGMESLAALVLFTVGPILGAVVQRHRSGRGVMGGVIGGIASYVGFGIVMYLRAYLSPEGITTQLMGAGLAFVLLAFWGALVGLAVGILVWGVTSIAGPGRNA